MKKLLLISFALCISATALADYIGLTATDTGVTAVALATTVTTNPIDMEAAGRMSNQLSMTFAVTPGTSAVIRVACFESELKTSLFGPIALCDSVAPVSSCAPDVREFTLSAYPTVSGVKYIVTRWGVKKKWAKCTAIDSGGGSGTVTITGSRSWQ